MRKKPKREIKKQIKKVVVREDFTPHFKRIKDYDRLYFNTPVDIVEADKFSQMSYSAQAFYQYLCLISFRKANKNGWFLITSKKLMEITKMDIRTIRRSKAELVENKFIDVGRAYEHDSNIHTSDCYRVNGFVDIIPEDINVG